MRILNSKQVPVVDKFTIENEPILSINLMERAAKVCFEWIVENFSFSKQFKIFVGSGNNGGDALAIARMLAEEKYNVDVYLLSKKLSPDSKINKKRLDEQKLANINFISSEKKLPEINDDDIIIDGMFGSGLSRSVEGIYLDVINHINKNKATVISIDIPSGLFAENNFNHKGEKIKADYTLTLEMPFLSFFFAENEDFIGEWIILPIGLDKDFINSQTCEEFYISKDFIKNKIKKRKKFSHKGTYGHSLLIAGSHGKFGAAILAARACLRSGAGLLTTHLPTYGCDIMQTAFPEAMISRDISDIIFSQAPDLENFDAIGIGCGIGKKNNTAKGLLDLLKKSNKPIILDADALNILSENKTWLDFLPKNSILTPHPKEFERLFGIFPNNYERHLALKEFAKKYNIYIVLKGANTATACPDGEVYFNSTGNAGMATAGSGDVLTGIILSFLSQKYSPKDAALIGVYIHGLAGDFAAKEKSEFSLIASDIIDFLPKAFWLIEPSK